MRGRGSCFRVVQVNGGGVEGTGVGCRRQGWGEGFTAVWAPAYAGVTGRRVCFGSRSWWKVGGGDGRKSLLRLSFLMEG